MFLPILFRYFYLICVHVFLNFITKNPLSTKYHHAGIGAIVVMIPGGLRLPLMRNRLILNR